MSAREFVYLADTAKGTVVRLSQISMLETAGNYTRFSLENGQSIEIPRSLPKCLAQLDPAIFFRANRQCVVNLGHVQETRPADAKRLMFRLTDGKQIVLTRLRSIQFRRRFSL